jgi:hypothetical protein
MKTKNLQERLTLIREDKRRSEYNPYEIGALERYIAERTIRQRKEKYSSSPYDIRAQTRYVRG